MKRKVISAIAVVLSVLAFNGFAFSGASFAADISGEIGHWSAADIVENKTVYDMAFFDMIEFYAYVEDEELTEQQQEAGGSFTVGNGSYSYYDPNNNSYVNVNGETKTFDLVLDYADDGYYEFTPKIGDSYVTFRDSADEELLGKQYSYLLLGEEKTGTFQYRTFSQQMASFVPYVERDSSGKNYTFRMVNPQSPQTALAIQVAGRYRLRARGAQGTLHDFGWVSFDAGDVPDGVFALPDSVNPNEIMNIRVNIRFDENPDLYYVWRFDICNETNAGITADSIPQAPVDVNVGEEVEIRIAFNAGYQGEPEDGPYKPIIISDRTVLSNDSWSYDPNTREGVFKLEGLKAGQTRFAVAYSGDESGWYHTAFTDVIVSGGTSGGGTGGSSSGGGGCDALGGSFAVLTLAALALSIKKRGMKN